MKDESELDFLNPAPDIHSLFLHFDDLYFHSALANSACSVEWSSDRMTLCGGICQYLPGGGIKIKLSAPLLKLRPTAELKRTLIHEMIHAALMLSHGPRNGGDDEPGGHGSRFRAMMAAINASNVPDLERPPGGYKIDTHHTMHAEVEHYRVHHWRCHRCGEIIKRAMNRAPQPADCIGQPLLTSQTQCRNNYKKSSPFSPCSDTNCRYCMHIKFCGGKWDKVAEPQGYQEGKRSGKRGSSAVDAAGSAKGGGNSGSAGALAKRAKEGRPITDFFPLHPGPSASHRALDTTMANAQQQQQQQKQLEEQLEERRRLAAEAAMRRMQGSWMTVAGTGCGTAGPSESDVIDLCSDDEQNSV